MYILKLDKEVYIKKSIKKYMKKLFLSLTLALGIILDVNYFSEVLANENLTRTKKNIVLKSWGNQIEIEVFESWKNNSEKNQNLTAYLPVFPQAENIHLFVNKGGRSFEVLEGLEKKDKIFQIAKENENSKLLGMGDFPFGKFLFSENLEILAGESLEIKWTWKQDLDFVSDFYLGKIFLDDGILTENFNISFVRDGKVSHHVFPEFGKGESYEKEGAFVWEFSEKNIKIPHFTFFISGVENPQLGYKYGGEFYEMAFKSIKNKNIFNSKTVILFDDSGSMYGAKWHRVQNIFTEILKNIPESTDLKVGFFGKNISWLKEDFEKNSYENQKKWRDGLSFISPKGASDWDLFLENFETLKTEDIENIILVGDFSDFPAQESLEKFENYNFNILALDLADKNYFEFLVRYLKGQTLNLFESAYNFAEKDLFLKKLKFLNSKIETPKSLDKTFLPLERSFVNNISENFVGRKRYEGESFSPLADFIPEIFGNYKVADYLEKIYKNTGSDADALWVALESIHRYFGLDLLEAGENFREKFSGLSEKDFWLRLWGLENSDIKISNIKKIKAEPFYGSPVLTALNFKENKFSHNLKIAPFSEAQKVLWKRFPEIFEGVFGLSNQVRFCSELRCVEVVESGVEKFSQDMLFYWKGFDQGHWGYEFAKILAEKNIIPVSEKGKIEFGKNVTRGEFISWIYDFKEGGNSLEKLPENIIKKKNIETGEVISDIFTDLPKDEKIKKAILWMVSKGIIQGYMDKTVRPNQNLTRAEAVKILLALNKFKPTETEILLETNIFTDVHGWEKPWVHEAFKRGMVKGYEDKSFRPQNLLNYAEAFKLIVKN